MISADLHSHTCFSHGRNTPFEMHHAAERKNLSVLGFTEHSPRPAGYDYSNEYREKLESHLGDYISQVQAIKKNAAGNPQRCQVLLGMEMDWLSGQLDFIERAARVWDFDYLIGSVHFIGHWGFDDQAAAWSDLSQEECDKIYSEYFETCLAMVKSELFQIAAHPDLIKIYSINRFKIWLDRPGSKVVIRRYLAALRDSGMAMEISSAGLRKACGEIYPAPAIAAMASEMNLSISLASDAHSVQDVAGDFVALEKYAKSFGFHNQTIFVHGRKSERPF